MRLRSLKIALGGIVVFAMAAALGVTAAVANADATPPEIYDRNPADGATGISRYAAATFRVRDVDSGVDVSSIHVEYGFSDSDSVQPTSFTDGDPYVNIITNLDSTVPTEALVTLAPPDPWEANKWVWISAIAKDLAGNEVSSTWRFSVMSATQGLSIINLAPPDGSTGVARDTSISFSVVDDSSAIVQTSISLTVNGTAVPSSSLTITGTSSDYTVSYTPSTAFGFGLVVQCAASASDAAGSQSTVPWSFTTEKDTTPPTITAVSPTDGQTGVAVGSSIVDTIVDSGTGVNATTVTMTVTAGGQAVSGSLNFDAGTGEATFKPADNLPYGSTINVHVEAADNATPRNTGTLDYSFTTQPKTYYLLGRIMNASNAPVSGATVNLTGQATASAVSDGNGYYQFTGLLAGDYTVQPSLSGWGFTPPSRDISLTADVSDADFVATETRFSLAGHVRLNGEGLAGVTIHGAGQTVVTGSDGSWVIGNLAAGTYSVDAVLANYSFTPASRSATITDADVTGLDFDAVPSTYTVDGLVTDAQGNRMGGVLITIGARTAVTAVTGRYTIGGLAAGSYSVTASEGGWQFTWTDAGGTVHTGAQAVTVPPSQTDINFTGYNTASQSFAAGLYLLSVPFQPRDDSPTSVFGTDSVARYDPTASPAAYTIAKLEPDAQNLTVQPGRGFFVYFSAPTTLQIAGQPVDPTASVSLAAPDGWNMLGNPYTTQLNLSQVKATSGTIRPFVYVYDAIHGTYLLVADQAGVGIARSYVLPWEGMWVRALGTSTVTISPSTSTTAAPSVKSLQLNLGAKGWWMPVEASAGDKVDTCCAVGVRSTGPALSLEKPPPMPNTVYVAVTSAAGEALSRSVQTASAGVHQWDLVVRTDLADTEVSVSLPDLSNLPNSLDATLTDLDTGKTTYMRTASAYTFRSGPNGAERHLKLTVAPRTSAGLVVSAASATASGPRVTLTYTASAPCTVSAQVLNMAGRVVRVITSGSAATAGVNTLSWDCRGASGSPVPAGQYLIQLDAAAPSGQRVNCVTEVTVNGAR